MKKLYYTLIFTLMVGLISGCNLVKEEKNAAKNIAKSFFEAVKAKDFDQAMTYYSPIFFKNTSIDWLQTLKDINKKLGGLETYELKDWKIEKYTGAEMAKGTYYVLLYEVTYSGGAAKETISLLKPVAGGEIKIIGHNISAQDLSAE